MRCSRVFITVFSALLPLLSGCATKTPDVLYHINEIGEVSAEDADLSSKLRLMASSVTRVMLPTLQSGKNMLHSSAWPSGAKPLAVIVEVDNRTMEFVNSRLVTDAIRAALRTHGSLQVLDDELPLAKEDRFTPPLEKNPKQELLPIYLPRKTLSFSFIVLEKEKLPPPASSKTQGQPSSQENSDRRAEVIKHDINKDIPPPSPPNPDTSPPCHEIDKSIAFEAGSRKREEILRFLEDQIKDQGTRENMPIYAIKTVLLPSASVNEVRKNTYIFKMFVEDIRSETIKWASSWEVQNAHSNVSNGAQNNYCEPVR